MEVQPWRSLHRYYVYLEATKKSAKPLDIKEIHNTKQTKVSIGPLDKGLGSRIDRTKHHLMAKLSANLKP